jgi:hypothetical protein
LGDLQEKLDEFQEQTKTACTEIMRVLEDNYCWKCPMRSSSKQSRCREVHAGRVLQEAVEKGITSCLEEFNIPEVELEAIIIRTLKKKIKRQGSQLREKTVIIKVEPGQDQDFNSDTWLTVKVNPRRVKIGEEVLIHSEPLKNPVLGSVALLTGFPFVISVVKRTFHEGSFWYVEVENKRIIPLESVFGVVMKMFNEGNSLYVD